MRRGCRRGRPTAPTRRSWALLRRHPEDVAGDVLARVGLDDLREAVPVRDAELPLDRGQQRVVEVEEAVAVAERLELLAPDRALQLAELRAADVLLGGHPDERVELRHVAVDRPQPRRGRRPADPGDGRALDGLFV